MEAESAGARAKKIARWMRSALLALLLAAPAPLSAQKKIEKRLPLGMAGALRIVNLVGTVVVHGWNKDTVLVRAALPPGDNLMMGGAYNGAKMFVESANERNPKPTQLEVWAPAGVRLWIKTATANIDVSDITGELDLYVVSGTINVTGTPSNLNAEAIDGDIHITGSSPWLRAKSASGAISLRGGSEDLALSTVSGPIVVDGGSFSRSRIETVTGNITFSGQLDRSGVFDFDSHSGAVDIALPEKSSVSFSAVTIAGTIVNKISRETPVPGRFGRGNELTLDLSGGGAKVSVRSFKGTVTLRRNR